MSDNCVQALVSARSAKYVPRDAIGVVTHVLQLQNSADYATTALYGMRSL